jgi:HlyD family secretion protein
MKPSFQDGSFTVPPAPPIRGPVVAGIAIGLLFFGGFGLWAATAPISSAAIASGAVRVEGNRKTVQHLEGGMIERIFVREGDAVEQGEVLIALDRTQAAAHRDALHGRYVALQAEKARLRAERDGAEGIDFTDALEGLGDDPRVSEIVAGQQQIFETRRQSTDRQVDILQQRIAQLRSQIDGIQGQVEAEERQLELIRLETDDVQRLLDKGLERKSRLLALQRETARLQGKRADHLAQIARAGQSIGEAELQILNLEDRLAAGIASDLEEVDRQLVATEEDLQTAEDVLQRREIRAPLRGTVVNLRFFTPGGVIESGVPVLDIVPDDDRLVIEAKVSPLDIDVVAADLPAQVRLTAFKRRTTPTLQGRVMQVSADRLADPVSGAPYYSALVEIDGAELQRVEGRSLYPGMPVDVIIETGARTLLQYLVSPIRDSFSHAFREQ